MAMVCTLSVFNGFRDLVGGLYTNFDPELLVSHKEGTDFSATLPQLGKLRQHPQVAHIAQVYEENALILFEGHPLVIQVKGVDSEYDKVTAVSTLLQGEKKPYCLQASDTYYCIPGEGLMRYVGANNFKQIQVAAPRQGERINLTNPLESFSVENIHNQGVYFSVGQQKYDDRYLLTSLNFAQNLFEKDQRLTQLEIKLRPRCELPQVKQDLTHILGKDFIIKDRLEQQEDVFRVMQLEKILAYAFLCFIVLLACFNIVSSLSMLIIEKRHDVQTLSHLGLSSPRIRRIFMTEGLLISLIGTAVGLSLGVLLCYLQQELGLISLGTGDNFIVSAYPVSVHWQDLLLIFATVVTVGFLSVWYPIQVLSKRFLRI